MYLSCLVLDLDYCVHVEANNDQGFLAGLILYFLKFVCFYEIVNAHIFFCIAPIVCIALSHSCIRSLPLDD